MRPFLNLEDVKLKIFINKPVCVGFLWTDVIRLGLVHSKTSKKRVYRGFFFNSNGEFYIPVLPIDIIVNWNSMFFNSKNFKYTSLTYLLQ